jgi:PAS domain S-box-containing protein
MDRTLSAAEMRRQAEHIANQSTDDPEAYTQEDMRTLIHDLRVHQIELEMQNDELKRMQQKVETLRQEYFELYDLAPIGYITMDANGVILKANLTGAAMLGADKATLPTRPFSAYLAKGSLDGWFSCLNRTISSDKRQACEIELTRRKAPSIWVELDCAPLQSAEGDKPVFACSMFDITQRIQATAELARTNRQLEDEAIKGEKTRKALKAQALQLKRRTEGLEQANTALKVLLDQREADKRELEEKVLVNVNELILPFVHKVKQGRLSRHQQEFIESMEATLKSIVSPMARNLTLKLARLTVSEIQVVELVRQGKTTKEIAGILNVAKTTVDYHRNRIRHKLGINKAEINLRTFLQTLPHP